MVLDRRQLIFGASAMALMPLGCTNSDKQRIAQLVQVLGTAAANVAVQVGQSDISDQIKAALPAVVKAINDWQLGTAPAQTAIQALNTLMGLLYLIPPASPYVNLINLAITTAEALLALIPAPPATTSDLTIARQSRKKVRDVPAPKKPVPMTAKEFEAQWKAIEKETGVTVPLK